MTRQSVSKHLAILEDANLVVAVRRGRQKLHYLNAVPIHEIEQRWISRFDHGRLDVLADLKYNLKGTTQMQTTQFVYQTYIRTTPERLWEAITTPAFLERWWANTALTSTWEPGPACTGTTTAS